MDYGRDQSDNQSVRLIRYINNEARGIDGTPVYVFPINMWHLQGISFQVIQSTLDILHRRDYIEVLQEPNLELTDEQRARRDDEQDYYFISVNQSFYDDYSRVIELATTLGQTYGVSIPSINPAPQPPPSPPQELKLRYDPALFQFTYGEKSLKINGPLRQAVCRLAFKNRKKAAFFDDILNEVDMNKQSRAVYDAIIAINKKLEESFGLNNVLTQKDETVRISKNYL